MFFQSKDRTSRRVYVLDEANATDCLAMTTLRRIPNWTEDGSARSFAFIFRQLNQAHHRGLVDDACMGNSQGLYAKLRPRCPSRVFLEKSKAMDPI